MGESAFVPALGGILRAYQPDRRLLAVERLMGGTSKGVYRLSLDGELSVIAYVWSLAETSWPEPTGMDASEPFTDVGGAALLVAASTALSAAGVRAPEILHVDVSHAAVPADVVLVEDVQGVSLSELLESNPRAAQAALADLGAVGRRLLGTTASWYGKVGLAGPGDADLQPPFPDVVLAAPCNICERPRLGGM